MRALTLNEMDFVAGGFDLTRSNPDGERKHWLEAPNPLYARPLVNWTWNSAGGDNPPEDESDQTDGLTSSIDTGSDEPTVVVITARRGDSYSYGNWSHVSTYNPMQDAQWLDFRLNQIHRDLNHNPGYSDINNGMWTAWEWTVDSLETALQAITGMISNELDENRRAQLLEEKARLEEDKRRLEERD